MVKNRRELPASRFNRVNSRPIRFPSALSRRNHDLNCFAARAWTLTGCGSLLKQAIATGRGETHYVQARRRGVAGKSCFDPNPVSIQILFRSKAVPTDLQ